jgi:DNA-binding response OmpR family regulator
VKILVVDDSGLMRRLAALALELQPGWQVIAAESGEEGLARARAEAPEAILLDAVMPDMDGAQTLTELRASPATRGIPVILVTARDGAEDRAEFLRLGAVGVIPKPFEVGRLAGQVSEILATAA